MRLRSLTSAPFLRPFVLSFEPTPGFVGMSRDPPFLHVTLRQSYSFICSFKLRSIPSAFRFAVAHDVTMFELQKPFLKISARQSRDAYGQSRGHKEAKAEESKAG